MTKISNFRLNTHYTALKQLPETYSASFRIGGTYGNGLGRVLGSQIITVPAGVYVETPLLRCGLDGGINHLSHSIAFTVGTYGTVYIAVTHVSPTQYKLEAILNNTDSASVTVPNATVELKLRLSTAPFDA